MTDWCWGMNVFYKVDLMVINCDAFEMYFVLNCNKTVKQQVPESWDGLPSGLAGGSSFSRSLMPSVACPVSITAPRQLKVTAGFRYQHTQTNVTLLVVKGGSLTLWLSPLPLLSHHPLASPRPLYLNHFLYSEDDSEGQVVPSYWIISSVTQTRNTFYHLSHHASCG